MENLKIIIADNSFKHAQLVSKVLISSGLKHLNLVYELPELMQLIKGEDSNDLLLISDEIQGLNLSNLIKDIKYFKTNFKAIVLFTDILNPFLISYFYRIGIDYVIHKNKINADLYLVIKLLFDQKFCYFKTPKIDFNRNLKLRNEIRDKLDSMNLPKKLSGYSYLVSAIELVYFNNNLGYAANKQLYPLVADHHQSNGIRVERSIRHVISKYQTKSKFRVKLTNMEFIFKIVEDLKRT